MENKYFLVLDLGTTGVKAILFDHNLSPVQKEYSRIARRDLPSGYKEQNPQELVKKSIAVIQRAVKKSGINVKLIRSLGITTQRETVIVWDSLTGKPVYPAILWQDNRTKLDCSKVSRKFGKTILSKTGLAVNPYFSASKLQWVLENVPNAKKLSNQKQLLFGTPDSWLLWNLTGSKSHYTDYTNASRTLLFNIKTLKWDSELCNIFGIPESILPTPVPSVSNLGFLKKEVLGIDLPIRAMCGDQQASLYAAGSTINTTKITFGTGAFAMQIVGKSFVPYDKFFVTLTASSGKPQYAVEAKFDMGAADVDKVLGNDSKMNRLLKRITAGIAKPLKHFPVAPKIIVIDGGITQSKYIKMHLENLIDAKIVNQDIYDGTALGIAKLLQ